MTNLNHTSLQTLLGISDSIRYKEFQIVLLLNKKKSARSYPKGMEIYGNKIDISDNVTGDFACLIFASETCSSDLLHQTMQSDQIFSKRFSGVVNALKMYLDNHRIYGKKIIKNQDDKHRDDRGLYCCFSNADISVNIVCYGDDGRKMDASSIQMLDQLIYMAQVRSGQLTTVKFVDGGIAEWNSRKRTTAEEEIQKLRNKYEQGIYRSASYDMMNSKEYYFDFEEYDADLPAGFEKHFIITGSTGEIAVFSKLTHLCKQIQRDMTSLVGE